MNEVPITSCSRQPSKALKAGLTAVMMALKSATSIRSVDSTHMRSRSAVRARTSIASRSFMLPSRSAASFWSSISVLVPTQRTTVPSSSLMGRARAMWRR